MIVPYTGQGLDFDTNLWMANASSVPPTVDFRGWSTIYLDPPWPTTVRRPQEPSRWVKRSAAKPYPTMGEKDLFSLPIDLVASGDALLVMWCPWSHLDLGIRLVHAWGFRVATGFPWVKRTQSGTGYRFGTGAWAQQCTEPLLICRRGKPFGSLGNPRPARKGVVETRGRMGHSRKPGEVREWLTRVSPAPRIELFARKPEEPLPGGNAWPPPGWHVWGQEAE